MVFPYSDMCYYTCTTNASPILEVVGARPPKNPGARERRSQKIFKVAEKIEANSYKTENCHLKNKTSVF